jgi:hypothetical protein
VPKSSLQDLTSNYILGEQPKSDTKTRSESQQPVMRKTEIPVQEAPLDKSYGY